jgi:phage regulator Rha-like protein
MLDSDLASVYGVETKALNRAVKRNRDRFPKDFMFQISSREWQDLKYQIGTSSSSHGGRRRPPYAFTEHGAIMAANVLNSARAVHMSVFVIRAFIKMREQIATNAAILKRLAEIDKTLLVHDSALRDVYRKLLPLLQPPPAPPTKRIGFHPEK